MPPRFQAQHDTAMADLRSDPIEGGPAADAAVDAAIDAEAEAVVDALGRS